MKAAFTPRNLPQEADWDLPLPMTLDGPDNVDEFLDTPHEPPVQLQLDTVQSLTILNTPPTTPRGHGASRGASCPRPSQGQFEDVHQQGLLIALGEHLEHVGKALSAYISAHVDASRHGPVMQPGAVQAFRSALSSMIPERSGSPRNSPRLDSLGKDQLNGQAPKHSTKVAAQQSVVKPDVDKVASLCEKLQTALEKLSSVHDKAEVLVPASRLQNSIVQNPKSQAPLRDSRRQSFFERNKKSRITQESPKLSHSHNECIQSEREAPNVQTSTRRGFFMKDAWECQESCELGTQSYMLAASAALGRTYNQEKEEPDFAYTEHINGWMRFLVSSPGTPFRMGWELFGLALVLYDLVTVPLLAVFDRFEGIVTQIMEWLTLVFWTLNVPVVLTTGFISDGVLILRPMSLLRNYLKTMFIVDVSTLVPDWFFTFVSFALGSDSGDPSLVRLLRIARLLRLARLMRLVKIRNTWNMLVDMIWSEKLGIQVNVIKMILVVLVVNHYIACGWFLVGDLQGEGGGKSWPKEHDYTNHQVDWGHQYVVAFHWSISQFTLNSIHVQPHSISERAYAIMIVVFSCIGFSYLVGSITSSLAKLNALVQEKESCFWTLRLFLKKNQVRTALASRITAYAKSLWDHREHHLKESEVGVLDFLSLHLKAELASELHGPSLCILPLFALFQREVPVTIRRLAFKGLGTSSLAPYDVMFLAGEVADSMSIVTSGILQYNRVVEEAVRPELVESQEDWIAEQVLWVKDWVNIGDMMAMRPVELVHVFPDNFVEIISLNPVALRFARSYAVLYVDRLSNLDNLRLSDIAQGGAGEADGTELREIIAKFAPSPPEVRRVHQYDRSILHVDTEHLKE